MLAKRIIPTLLYRGTLLVKGERFNGWRSVGNVMQAARIYVARDVDELIMLDITATAEGRRPDFTMVERLAQDNFSPLTVGGGVRAVHDVQDLLNAGADKVAIGTAYGIIHECAERFGRQAIVASLNIKDQDAVEEAVEVERMGAGEILLNAVERDGTLIGYNLDMIRAVTNAVEIPVIASGGCSGYEDMKNALTNGADAVAAGALFQFTMCTPKGAAQYLHKHGIEVRI